MSSTIIPCLRYRDAPAMIDWLCRAFGFETQAVYASADGKKIDHAQLTYGGGMIMLGSADNGSSYDALVRHPDELGKISTQAPYLVVKDCDSVYRSVIAAGAEIVMPLEGKDYGGKGFACRDPEGYLWSVGSYDPWVK
jgi:uncharacterized glyoxalase superfamily protein PhnB